MSVLIRGMEMPDKCGHCRFATAFECEVTKNFITTFNVRQVDCPLVPVPPHGRLIDADANLSVMRRVLDNPYTDHGKIDTAMIKACIAMFEEAPTVLKAEEGE